MTSIRKCPLVVLVGPTAVGKTEISIQLARRLDAEIVSADSRQFYRGMDIGTAKPTPAERALARHHLIDIANPDETLSLVVFQRLAQEAISAIQSRGRVPLLVGGTGQYIRAVTGGWRPPAVQPNARLRADLERMQSERGGTWLHAWLSRTDPEAAVAIDHRNSRRTIRAVEVILTTGRQFSAQRARTDSLYHLVVVGLWLPRPVLYARIDARIESMFDAGLLQETRGLLSQGYSQDLPALSAIGYRECLEVLDGRLQLEQAKTAIRRATRAFVRRQANWFKESDPEITWFEASDPNVISAMESFVRQQIAAK